MGKRQQHRQEREPKSLDLEKENKALKRQINRLLKQIRQQELYEEASEPETTTSTPEAMCPICGEMAIKSFTTPTGRVRSGCTSCKKYRKAV